MDNHSLRKGTFRAALPRSVDGEFDAPVWSSWNWWHPRVVVGTQADDVVEPAGPLRLVTLKAGNDTLRTADTNASVGVVIAGPGNDTVLLTGPARRIHLGEGDDTLEAATYFHAVRAGGGNDHVFLREGAKLVNLGSGNDSLTLDALAAWVHGGRGDDLLTYSGKLGDLDISLDGGTVIFSTRFTGETMLVRGVEHFHFDDAMLSLNEIRDTYGDPDVPVIRVGAGTQITSVNDPDPTVSVMWDRIVQQAVIEHDGPNGPTIASRAYAMVHTAIYDAWATFDATAVRVSFDAEDDNAALEAAAAGLGAAEKAKAMSYAAYSTLMHLYPDQNALFAKVMADRYGYSLSDDGSLAAAIGIDAAEDLLVLRTDDGSNEAGGYTSDFTPTNPHPLEINDIAAWTPENVPLDPEDDAPEQRFLTPQWGGVESFALPEAAAGDTDLSGIKPAAPQQFFIDAQAGATLDVAAETVTLAAPVTVDGTSYAAGDTIPVSKALIGSVINPGFIEQAERVVEYSANLDEEQKLISEFWEDAGGTPFPPGTSMTFGQFVSARDDHTLDQDAQMFLALGNAVFDAGIAAWATKVETDYTRPVRAIRELGELGLIGEWGADAITGEEGYVIEAFAGFDPLTGESRGTQTILAENFTTYQRPFTDPSPPFAEYVSGHSTFSAAGAEVLKHFTGSDEFGASAIFPPGSAQFDDTLPTDEIILEWATFSEAADEAGLSRLYGGIHFEDGDMNGRALGREVGASVAELAQSFIDGTATDADRPFWTENELFVS